MSAVSSILNATSKNSRARSGVDDAPVSKLLIAGIAVGALILGALGGGLIVRGTASSKLPVAEPTPVTTAKLNNAPNAGPSRFEGMVPVGYLRNEAGAVAAAQSYTAMTNELIFRPEAESRAAARAISIPESADQVEAAYMGPILGIKQAFAVAGQANPNGRGIVRSAPIGTRVLSYSGDQARIEVWTLSNLALEIPTDATKGQLPATQSVFTTMSYELVWSNGDWHVSAFKSVNDSGPAVVHGTPTDVVQFINQASSFAPFRYQASRGVQ